MMKIKLCGLTNENDIEAANRLRPDLIGFVFAPKSKRFVSKERALFLKKLLLPSIQSVGVFVNEDVEKVAELLNEGVIDIAQLHGSEDNDYIKRLHSLSSKPVIQAFKIHTKDDLLPLETSAADYILLDSGAGSGDLFDWDLIKSVQRPYFLAGGLNCDNVKEAILKLDPYGIDVSSGIESNGSKDPVKMNDFVNKARQTYS